MGDLEQYLDGWKGGAALGGGAILGVAGTRTIDNMASGRWHPLALYALKCAFSFGVGSALSSAGYPTVGAGLVFGGFADSTVTYADQIQYRYLPGAPSGQ